MSGSGDRGLILRLAGIWGLILASVVAAFVLGRVVLAREVVPLETANFPFTAEVSDNVAVYMGPGVYRVMLHFDENVSGEARVCCLMDDSGVSGGCARFVPGDRVVLECSGPGILVCYNASVPPFHPSLGYVEVVKEWP